MHTIPHTKYRYIYFDQARYWIPLSKYKKIEKCCYTGAFCASADDIMRLINLWWNRTPRPLTTWQYVHLGILHLELLYFVKYSFNVFSLERLVQTEIVVRLNDPTISHKGASFINFTLAWEYPIFFNRKSELILFICFVSYITLFFTAQFYIHYKYCGLGVPPCHIASSAIYKPLHNNFSRDVCGIESYV